MPEPKKVAAAAPGPGVAEAEELARRNANPAAHTAHVIGQGCKACEERIRAMEDAERTCKAANESQRKTIIALEAELADAKHYVSYTEWARYKDRAEKLAEQVQKLGGDPDA